MGDAAEIAKPKRTRKAKARRGGRLSDFVAERAPDVYITFLSILVGVVLADLLKEVQGRVPLWPLDAPTLRSWGQIGGVAGSALGAWAVYAHLSIVQRRVPTFYESLAAFAGPMILLLVDSFVGLENGAAWFYGASAFLFVGIWASAYSVTTIARSEEGGAFRRLLRLNGYMLILLVGAPTYALAGLATQLGWLSIEGQAAISLTTIPAAIALPLLYFRDWKHALEIGPARSSRWSPPEMTGDTVVEVWAGEKVADVFVTLLSVTFGLALQDVVDQARDRMVLWPLAAASLIAWGQIAAVVACAMAAWLISSHLAISRRGLPSYAQTLNAAMVPLFLLSLGGLAGRDEIWPWLYAGGVYLAVSAITVRWFLRFANDDEERRLLITVIRPTGFMAILYGGTPLYLLAGLLGQLDLLRDWIAFVLVWGAAPAAMLCAWLFFRDWRRALGAPAPY